MEQMIMYTNQRYQQMIVYLSTIYQQIIIYQSMISTNYHISVQAFRLASDKI